ncbi:hypothetical protein pEaSNUABM6_00150 [Erwinia phage pEa_SNUABM_6]|nr:hypothetical protein pEaSNUABM6_00150 [Erwinia phage pEa_SNUABM_6]
MLKPRKAKTSLAIVTRYSSGLKGFPEGFAVYLGKKRVRYIDGVEVGEIVGPLGAPALPVFNLPKITRVMYRQLQDMFCRATIGMGSKYYGLRKLKPVPKTKNTYMEELQESLFGKPDYNHIGINANRDAGMQTSMDVLFKGGIHNGADRLKRKIENNPGVSGAFDRRLGRPLDNTVNELYSHPGMSLTGELRIRDVALAMADFNVNVALRKMNFSEVKVMYTSDVLKDVENELRTCQDDRNHINRMLELRKTLPQSAGTYTIVDKLIKLPLLSQLTDAICAAGKRAMAELPPEDFCKLDDPTPETLVDWLILFGSLNPPKTLDYLGTLSPTATDTATKALYDRVRAAAGINEGDEAVARTVALARTISPHLHDPYAFSRALRNGEPVLYMDTEMPMDMSGLEKLCVPGLDPQEVFARYVKQRQKGDGQEFTIDSLSQANSLLKDNDDA